MSVSWSVTLPFTITYNVFDFQFSECGMSMAGVLCFFFWPCWHCIAVLQIYQTYHAAWLPFSVFSIYFLDRNNQTPKVKPAFAICSPVNFTTTAPNVLLQRKAEFQSIPYKVFTKFPSLLQSIRFFSLTPLLLNPQNGSQNKGRCNNIDKPRHAMRQRWSSCDSTSGIVAGSEHSDASYCFEHNEEIELKKAIYSGPCYNHAIRSQRCRCSPRQSCRTTR